MDLSNGIYEKNGKNIVENKKSYILNEIFESEDQTFEKAERTTKEMQLDKDIIKTVDILTTSQLPSKTQKLIMDYTLHGYVKMNALERVKEKQTLEQKKHYKELQEKCDLLSAELQKHEVKRPFVVYKGIDCSRLKMMLKDGTSKKLDSHYSLIGNIIRDRGFLSATIDNYCVFSKRNILIIEVPSGTKGAYIANVSICVGEKEFLIDRDSYLLVKSIEHKGNVIAIKCKLLNR